MSRLSDPRFILATALLTLGGCGLYFGDDPPCAYSGDDRGGAPLYAEFRDPNTATCVPGYGGGYCDDSCGPCATTGAEQAQPDMGRCESPCTGLDESACHATSACYAAYLDNPADDGGRRFWGCWQTAPSGPVGGVCANLSAHECSRHDDCSLDYVGGESSAKFDACVSEPPRTCANVDCGAGYTCEEQCYGDKDDPGTMTTCSPVCVPDVTCAAADCGPGTTCGQVCTTSGNGVTTCETACIPDHDPGTCYGAVNCFINPPACPSGTTPGVRDGCYTGYCIPTSQCGPSDPGSCTGDVACDALPPQCPSGTVPGISGACWSGYCIPTSQCPAAACETLTTESTCEARGDCTPVYTGTNCTCYPGYCECSTLTFDRCQSAML